MNPAAMKTLQAAIDAVRADLASDKTEDSGSSADTQDMADDRKLLAALDAVTKMMQSMNMGGMSDQPPKTLKEASAKARETFAAGRANPTK